MRVQKFSTRACSCSCKTPTDTQACTHRTPHTQKHRRLLSCQALMHGLQHAFDRLPSNRRHPHTRLRAVVLAENEMPPHQPPPLSQSHPALAPQKAQQVHANRRLQRRLRTSYQPPSALGRHALPQPQTQKRPRFGGVLGRQSALSWGYNLFSGGWPSELRCRWQVSSRKRVRG